MMIMMIVCLFAYVCHEIWGRSVKCLKLLEVRLLTDILIELACVGSEGPRRVA